MQISWENTLYGGWRVVRRRVVAWVLYVLLLCFALGVQIVLSMRANREREMNQTGGPDDSDDSDVDGDGFRSTRNGLKVPPPPGVLHLL